VKRGTRFRSSALRRSAPNLDRICAFRNWRREDREPSLSTRAAKGVAQIACRQRCGGAPRLFANPGPATHVAESSASLGDRIGTIINNRGDGTVDVQWDDDFSWNTASSERRAEAELWPVVPRRRANSDCKEEKAVDARDGDMFKSSRSNSFDDEVKSLPDRASILKKPGDRRLRKRWSLSHLFSSSMDKSKDGEFERRPRSVSFKEEVDENYTDFKLDDSTRRMLWYTSPELDGFVAEAQAAGVKRRKD